MAQAHGLVKGKPGGGKGGQGAGCGVSMGVVLFELKDAYCLQNGRMDQSRER